MTNEHHNSILVTGATGQLGSELIPALRKQHGRDNVVAAGHVKLPSSGILDSGPFENLDVTDKVAFDKIVVNYGIDTVYHLAGILSASGEKNPELAWHVNTEGLHNILEIARERKMKSVFWPSSIAVFGANVPRAKTPQDASLIPGTVYGVTKVSGELICNYYFARYGLDVRSLRYPGIISSETPPGGGTTDYAVEIFYEAIRKKRYKCFVRKDTVLPMLYMPDCIEAALRLMRTDSSQIKVRTSYNLNGLSFSAEELASEIKKFIPGFECFYEPDFRQNIADSWPQSMDDTAAYRDWGWSPTYDLASMTLDMIRKLSLKLS